MKGCNAPLQTALLREEPGPVTLSSSNGLIRSLDTGDGILLEARHKQAGSPQEGTRVTNSSEGPLYKRAQERAGELTLTNAASSHSAVRTPSRAVRASPGSRSDSVILIPFLHCKIRSSGSSRFSSLQPDRRYWTPHPRSTPIATDTAKETGSHFQQKAFKDSDPVSQRGVRSGR
ncbi:hypothetical protein SKAU_G00292820 [Synaphobranchus kaupii]|uniref:Uncharacterized protein n=1 Tax=Synaphobranchus kaupii TaxID=118154 RepID=A0A9Q1IM94_SYNKA|nr:hypothetical protein SKAU_G00292820 [Synaphobranchus kaupii]